MKILNLSSVLLLCSLGIFSFDQSSLIEENLVDNIDAEDAPALSKISLLSGSCNDCTPSPNSIAKYEHVLEHMVLEFEEKSQGIKWSDDPQDWYLVNNSGNQISKDGTYVSDTSGKWSDLQNNLR